MIALVQLNRYKPQVFRGSSSSLDSGTGDLGKRHFPLGPVHWWMLGAGFLVRLVYAFMVSNEEAYGGWDGFEYWGFAKSLAAFEGCDYPRFFNYTRSPGYPMLLVPLAWLQIDPVRPMQVLQCVAGTALAWIAGGITGRWAGRVAGNAAFAIVLFHPFLVITSAFILTETSFITLLWAGLACLQRLTHEAVPNPSAQSTRWILLGGLAIGAATLVRPALQVFLIPAAIWIGFLFLRPAGLASAFRSTALFTIVVSALLLPWQLHNHFRHGEFGLGPGYGQAAFYLSNCMEYYNGCRATTKAEYYTSLTPSIRTISLANGVPRDQWIPLARQFKTAHPIEWRWVQFYKLRHVLRPWLNPVAFGRIEVLASVFANVPLFLGAAAELVRRRGRLDRFGGLLAALTISGILIGGVVFSASVRYRIPLMDMAFVILTSSFIGQVGLRRARDSQPTPSNPSHAAGTFCPGNTPPLFVDLDGTLIHGDTLIHSMKGLLGRQPWQMVPLAAALLDGRSAFKDAVARRWIPSPESLPYRNDVIEFIRAERGAGRQIILATAANLDIAAAVAGHLGLFDHVLASDRLHNLKGAAKVDAIRDLIGSGPFDYIGDSRADLPVFAAARISHLVSPAQEVLIEAKRLANVGRVFQT